MGQSAAQTVREIEEVRDRLDRNLGELQARLPAPARWVKKVAGVAAGGGIGGAVFWFAAKRLRGKGDRAKSEMPQVQVIREGSSSSWQPLIAIGVAVLVGLRLGELREAKKQTR